MVNSENPEERVLAQHLLFTMMIVFEKIKILNQYSVMVPSGMKRPR